MTYFIDSVDITGWLQRKRFEFAHWVIGDCDIKSGIALHRHSEQGWSDCKWRINNEKRIVRIRLRRGYGGDFVAYFFSAIAEDDPASLDAGDLIQGSCRNGGDESEDRGIKNTDPKVNLTMAGGKKMSAEQVYTSGH